MLSESMALSMTALFAAAILHLVVNRTMLGAAYTVGASVLWVFTRQNHVVLLGLIVATILAVFVVDRWRTGRFDKVIAVTTAGLVAIAAMAGLTYGRNTEIVHFNLAMVIGQRVITDAENLTWFLDHDMPLPDVVTPGEAIFPEPLLADPAFADWVADEGSSTYIQFLVTHPWATLTAPLEDFVSDRPSYGDVPIPDETMLSTAEAYGSARQVVPEPIEDILFDPGSTGTLLVVFLVVLLLTWLRWQRAGWDRRWLVPLLAIFLQWPALTIVWHASTAELGRLALISAVLLRLGLIVQAALLVDGWLADAGRLRPVEASVDVGREGIRDVDPEVDEGIGEGGGDGDGTGDDGEPVAEDAPRRRRRSRPVADAEGGT
jgi:hypothetical protein